MQRPWGPQRDVAYRHISTRSQAEDTSHPNSSVLASNAGTAAEAGSAEAALLQPKAERGGGGGGPGNNTLIGQLYIFGRWALALWNVQNTQVCKAGLLLERGVYSACEVLCIKSKCAQWCLPLAADDLSASVHSWLKHDV